MHKYLLNVFEAKKLVTFTVISMGFLFVMPRTARAIHPRMKICAFLPDGTEITWGSGVARYQDETSTECKKRDLNNTRFLEKAKYEKKAGSSITFMNTYPNCASFVEWDKLSCAQQNWLQSHYIDVPGLGSQKRSARGCGSAAYGCSQNPLFFGYFMDGYSCQHCVKKTISNGGMYTINVTCTPINAAPNVNVSGPGNCATSGTFSVSATDPDGDNVTQIQLELSDGPNPYIVDFYPGSSVSTPSPNAFVFSPTPATPSAGSSVNASVTVTNLAALGQNVYKTISYRARAKDVNGKWSSWVSGTSIIEEWRGNVTGDIALASVEGNANGEIEMIFNMSGAKNCTYRWKVNPYDQNWSSIASIGTSYQLTPANPSGCTAGGRRIGTYYFTPATIGSTYQFCIRGERGFCDCNPPTSPCFSDPICESVEVVTADPWMMTSGGDSYSYAGFTDLEMQDVTGSFGVATGYAYFSTFINSRNSGSWIMDGRNTRRNYILGASYGDNNRGIVGPDAEIFNYLQSLAGKNACVTTGTLPSIGGCPDGSHVYIIDDASGTTTISGDWLNQSASADRACIIVTNGDLQIAAGTNDPDQIDAFFLVDGTFSTVSDSQVLLINGSVIANEVDFNRELLDNSANPAEIVRYDPKYLDLLRDCLGKGYEFAIKEYKYSTPQ